MIVKLCRKTRESYRLAIQILSESSGWPEEDKIVTSGDRHLPSTLWRHLNFREIPQITKSTLRIFLEHDDSREDGAYDFSFQVTPHLSVCRSAVFRCRYVGHGGCELLSQEFLQRELKVFLWFFHNRFNRLRPASSRF